jgi:hypothetical protein
VRLKLDILILLNHSYNNPSPSQPTPNVTIQFIEFTYCNDRFPTEKVTGKETKYAPLIRAIQNRGWNVAPLIVITTGTKRRHNQTTKTHLNQSLLKLKNVNTKNMLNTIPKMQSNSSWTSFSPKEELKTNNHSPRVDGRSTR